MPQINIKLFASLRRYMPEGASNGGAPLELPEEHTVASVLESLNVPLEQCHLVVVNGVFIPPEERGRTTLCEGDALAVWPPVAGG